MTTTKPTKTTKTKYNCTELNPSKNFERHVYHRDQFAHYLRWTYALNLLRRNMNVLDFGCGSGQLLEVIYRNRLKAAEYTGYDIRKRTINNNNKTYEKLDWANFKQVDLCNPDLEPTHCQYDLICSFEVAEHIGKHNIDTFLRNIVKHMNKDTILLLSTPCFDARVGAAKNHIIDGEVGEFGYEELKHILVKYFTIEEHFGTFASQRDYKPEMNEHQLKMFNQLNKYYDANLVSILFAPLFPHKSRNCIWRLRLKLSVQTCAPKPT